MCKMGHKRLKTNKEEQEAHLELIEKLLQTKKHQLKTVKSLVCHLKEVHLWLKNVRKTLQALWPT